MRRPHVPSEAHAVHWLCQRTDLTTAMSTGRYRPPSALTVQNAMQHWLDDRLPNTTTRWLPQAKSHEKGRLGVRWRPPVWQR